MRLTPSYLPADFSTLRRRLLVALVGDLLLLAAILTLALDFGTDRREAVEPPPRTGLSLAGPLVPDDSRAPSLAGVEVDVRQVAEESEGDVGLTLLGPDGAAVMAINADQRFVLASVSKVYLLATYLDQLYETGQQPGDSDMELLQPMIRVSDNASATAVWKQIGGSEGVSAFLAERGLAPVLPAEEDSWGTLEASAGQVAELLWRLSSGSLLDPESTQVAMALLADINEEQSWGVSAGAADPDAMVFLKNGWYPEEEGWRVNSAGVVRTPDAAYVLVVLSYPEESLAEGIALIEDVARRINGVMGR